MIRFDEEKHIYSDKDGIIPSVTYVLRATGVVPPINQFMRGALARGRAVHKAIELFDQGMLDFSTVDNRIEPWLDAYVTWAGREGERFKRRRNEVVLFSKSKRIAGRADGIATDVDEDCPAVIEFKSGEKEPWHVFQVTGYWSMVVELKRERPKANGWLVYLKKDGTYRQEQVKLDAAAWSGIVGTFNLSRARHVSFLAKLQREEALDD